MSVATPPMSAAQNTTSHARWLRVYLTPVVVFLLVAAVFAIDGWRERVDLIDAGQRNLAVRAAVVGNALDSLFQTVGVHLAEIAGSPRSVPDTAHLGPENPLAATLAHLRQLAPITGLIVTGADGRIRGHSDAAEIGRDASVEEYFTVHANAPGGEYGRLSISRPFVTHEGQKVIAISRAAFDAQGEFSGVVAASVAIDSLGEILTQVADAQRLSVALVDDAGNALVNLPAGDDALVGHALQDPTLRARLAGDRQAARHRASSAADGRLWAMRDLRHGGLTLMVARDEAEALAAWRASMGLRLLILIAFGLTIGFLTGIVRQRQQQADRIAAVHSAVVSNSSDVIMIFDRAGRVTYVSPAVSKVTGFPEDRGLGMTFKDFCHHDDFSAVADAWQRLERQPEASERINFRVLHRDGHWVHIEAFGSSHFETEGIRGVLLVARDVTERVAAEIQLRRSEEMLKRAQAVAQIGSWHFDADAQRLVWSDETYRIFGIAPGTPIDFKRVNEITHPDDRDMVREEWHAALRGEPYEIGHRIVVGEEVLWVQEKADMLFDDEGRMLSATGTVQDVTAQHAAAQQLSELLEFTEKIIAESPVGIAVYHADGPCVIANESIAQMTGGRVEEARAQNFRRLTSWRELGLLDAAMEALQSGRPVRKVASGLTSFGKTVALDCEFATIMRHGQRHLLLLANDVSEFKAAELALLRATQLAEDASRAKSEFLANMSHEIRTPMNAVIGLAQLALNHTDDPTLREYLRQMFDSGSALLRLINNILDYSKIEAGELDLENNEFELRELAESVARMFRLTARSKGIDLSVTVAANVPDRLSGDSIRLNQVLVNLVGNAVKFTATGGVELRIDRVDNEIAAETGADGADGSPRCRLRFAVIDTGVGIADAHLPRLFQPFVQADGSITRRFGGTGLGLSISRRLVLLMGGDITVDSKPDSGSRFQFSLEFPVLDAADGSRRPATSGPVSREELAAAGKSIAGACVLIVEDDALNRRVLAGLLDSAGLRVDIATGGDEALMAMEKGNHDAVLMDLHLADIDGYEATRRIRARKAWQGIPVIAVTASPLADTREKCIAAGMDDFLGKPVAPRELIATLVRHLTRPGARSRTTLPADDPRAQKLHQHLARLKERLAGNDFISAIELAQLRELTNLLGGDAGARLENAISHYDYSHAKILIDDIMNTLDANPPHPVESA